tara:strand:- start:38 stop:502 length:465 start_codon:yes stop_codon:yes gene_type:complete
MGQYHKLINITKKEYIVGHDIGINLKHYEQIGFEGSMADVLYCLMIAQGNDPRGGGDVSGHKYIGRWTGDDVAIVGDYYDDELGDNHKYYKLYDEVEADKDYKNISPSIRSMLRVIYPKLTIKKQILKGSDRDLVMWNREWRPYANSTKLEGVA